ncbi:head decoration protein [Escherichia coli]|nr:head decoration protein [Escherichia coli]EHR9096948.1 head decoration protein [Escherichia coli]EIM2919083.1 head decoration protein [Escherichia coli]EIM2935045.1 head decoration protein [Escherichia coli]EIM2959656.1 head decoration protein [Escherichia coli]
MTQVYGNNPFSPGGWAMAYAPDQLIAGPLQLITKTVTVTGSAAYSRGTVLGVKTSDGKYTLCVKTAEDGSQTPVAILVDDVDASSGDVQAGVYLMGEFNADRVTYDSSWQADELVTALEKEKIFLRTPVSAD